MNVLHRILCAGLLGILAALAAMAQTNASANATPGNSSGSWLTPTEELNAQLPYWLRFHGQERMRAEGADGQGFQAMGDGYLLNRFRFQMDVLPTTWLTFHFQVQDAEAFGKNNPAPPYQDTWDLRLAYLEIGDLEKYHATFRVGRQELNFGDRRLIGWSDWSNVGRTFDGYRATVRDGKFSVDAFAASVVVVQDGQVGQHTPGNYIDGLYGEMRNVVPHTTIQPYFFWRRAPLQKMGDGKLATEDFGTTGLRWVGSLPARFDILSETALQRGSLGTNAVAAWAEHLVLGYKIPSARLKHTHYTVEYNFASGDANPRDNVHGSFDTLYASGHDKIAFADQVGWKNVQHFRTGPEVKVSKKLQVAFKYSDFWLANAHDALYNSSGNVVVARTNGTAGRWVGQEFDGTTTYTLNKTTEIGGGYGYLLPGTFLQLTTPGHSYHYPYLFYSTKF